MTIQCKILVVYYIFPAQFDIIHIENERATSGQMKSNLLYLSTTSMQVQMREKVKKIWDKRKMKDRVGLQNNNLQ